MKYLTETLLPFLILCAILALGACLFSSCTKIANLLESQLECDEEVNIELKAKVDFKDEDEKN